MLNRSRLVGAICTVCVLLAASGCSHPTARVGVGSAGVEIRIDPSAVAVSPGGSQTFTCTVTGSMNTGCSWQVTEANGGSVTGTGAYVAPSGVGSYHVVATANADTTKTATATVVVTAPSAPD